MTRFLYGLAWGVATPFALARLAWRARRQPGYLLRWRERLGRYDPVEPVPRIWIHAVSVGETRAAAPIVEALRARYPGHRILLTHMTPTGYATGEALFGDRVERAWLPYDLAGPTRRFLAHFRPEFGLLLETEVWPRLLEEGVRARVPVMLVNGRLSERSAARYARWPSLSRWAFGNLAGIAAQTASDAQRFRLLSTTRVAVTGNVKFDLVVPPEMMERGRALRRSLGDSRPVWVAGSTREGEEAALLDAFASLDKPPGTALVIVPRHPQRFDEVASLVAARGMRLARRSGPASIGATTEVLVGDSMGEMLAYYAAGDVAIVGGSLLPFGSQNLIEPCALGKPVVVGPSTYNFEEAADGAIAAGAAIRVPDASRALMTAAEISRDAARRDAMGAAAAAFVAAHRGAVDRLLGWLEATRASAPGPG